MHVIALTIRPSTRTSMTGTMSGRAASVTVPLIPFLSTRAYGRIEVVTVDVGGPVERYRSRCRCFVRPPPARFLGILAHLLDLFAQRADLMLVLDPSRATSARSSSSCARRLDAPSRSSSSCTRRLEARFALLVELSSVDCPRAHGEFRAQARAASLLVELRPQARHALAQPAASSSSAAACCSASMCAAANRRDCSPSASSFSDRRFASFSIAANWLARLARSSAPAWAISAADCRELFRFLDRATRRFQLGHRRDALGVAGVHCLPWRRRAAAVASFIARQRAVDAAARCSLGSGRHAVAGERASSSSITGASDLKNRSINRNWPRSVRTSASEWESPSVIA